MYRFLIVLLGFAVDTINSHALINLENDGVSLIVNHKHDIVRLTLKVTHDGIDKLNAEVGVGLSASDTQACTGVENCYIVDGTRLHVTPISNGFQILWTTQNTSVEFRDCFSLENSSWYGGPERFYQAWPIEKLNLSDYSYVTKEDNWTAIAEPYWLNSLGAYIYVNEEVPLFVDQNNYRENTVCFIARAESPYRGRNKVLLNYTVVAAENAKEAHLHAVETFLGKPTGHPNEKMIQRPIFSTWARYSRNVNDTVVLDFSQEIIDNGYEDAQFELDDHWETCYGSLEFNGEKFSQINSTVNTLKERGFRVTLWIHPFVNVDCANYTETGLSNDFFVKGEDGSVLTQWWNSNEADAQYLDFSNGEVREWFTDRLKLLQEKHGIDSFKFDAGESSWAPSDPVLKGDVDRTPNSLTENYVRTCATFGDLIEIRSGWRTQDLPVFVRMIDKDSTWGIDNGLYTLVTTLLQMNINGYTMVLPDMIGGNGYNGAPDAELFVRWLQANTFMPSIQFSFVPWDFGNSTIDTIAKKFVDLHYQYSDYIVETMHHSVMHGYPVNPPIWWVDPTNADALTEDTQYLLGEDILVAPVLEQGATSRDVVLPAGSWVDGNDGTVYSGNQTLKDYPAPLDVLPYFIREGSDIADSNVGNTLRINGLLALLIIAVLNVLY